MRRAWAATGLLWSVAAIASGQWVSPVEIRLDPTGNGILEPGETIAVSPYWRTCGNSTPGGPSTLASFSGPSGPTRTIVDGLGLYSGFPALCPPATCSDCYVLRVDSVTRPVQHWDDSIFETVHTGQNINTHTWTLHVGATFTDVPPGSPFYRFVETIVHKGVTGGCSATAYCPTAAVSREGMAVFLLVAREPPGYAPPPCGATPLFSDVPVSSPFCPWIEELARRGIAGGCGGGNYCPAAPVSRQEMAVFLLAGGTTPPPCSAAPFLDVPAASPFCPWIRDLVAMGVTAGCGNGNYCPTAPVTREQMSVFLTTRFGLVLYGL